MTDSPISVYIGAPWVRRDVAAEVARQLEDGGYTITHKWWNFEAGDEEHEKLAQLARLDQQAVMECDIFVLLNLEKSEGKAVESGIALTRHMTSNCRVPNPLLPYAPPRKPRLIGCGPRETCIFHHLPEWEWYDKPRDVVKKLLAEVD